jgi:hypothetical protein
MQKCLKLKAEFPLNGGLAFLIKDKEDIMKRTAETIITLILCVGIIGLFAVGALGAPPPPPGRQATPSSKFLVCHALRDNTIPHRHLGHFREQCLCCRK